MGHQSYLSHYLEEAETGTTYYQTIAAVALASAVVSNLIGKLFSVSAVGVPGLSRLSSFFLTLAPVAVAVGALNKGLFNTLAVTGVGDDSRASL
jgi:hypothetical protein